ncbi:hypothetical protein BKA82DRAFT_25979 [Pisolithus tinctorius]|uniref:Uncharacterized protein n=1 Tax=Pisolithus tinctorius Marx 270 TaxID=870435 RepID=A0A0C3NVL3_PISTI|nr:hypothetical protein BKA82DRAFT_25979 [Pisolithus tinctorius]KIO04890.1 hypothetical protein M404DRAFT_25979 [Pisolithus tinctorius Marx 270]
MSEIPSPSTGLDISSSNLSALITLIRNLELNAADTETLASALLLRSRAEAFIGSSGSQPTYPTAALCPSSPGVSGLLSHKECTPATLSPSIPIYAEFPTPPVSIHLTPPNSTDPSTILVRGHPDCEARVPYLVDDCVHTPTGIFFTISM